MSSGVNSASSSIFLKKSVSYGNLRFFNKVYLRYKNSSLYAFTILFNSLLNSENESLKCFYEL